MSGGNCIGLQRIILREIHPNIYNALIIGMIIGKQRPRIFSNLNNKENNETRAVLSFTIRDSLQDYINVTCWGSGEALTHLNDEFHIGDVVEIIKPRIEIRKVNDYGEQFRPMVTSPYALTINEPMSQLIKHEGDCLPFKRLLSYPTKPMAGFVTISNILSSSNLKNEVVDMLVSVRSIAEIRNVAIRSGSQMQVRDVVVFDHTNPGIKVSIWEPEIMIRASNWKPRSTILFMTDMKIEWNNFFKAKTATVSQRTIITEDPVGPEAETLRNYALSAPLQPSAILDVMACSIPNPNTIQNVMTVRQVFNKIDVKQHTEGLSPEDQQFTGLLFAMVTHLDLDGLTRVVTTRCARCKTILPNQTVKCEKTDCPVSLGIETVEPETSFDVRLNLADHTGTLNNCRLTGRTAEVALDCTVHEFLQMNDDKKMLLKWKYLMERCAVRVMVLCSSVRTPLISILSLVSASPTEVANRLPHY